jgi:hypothetical protein
MYFQQTDCEEKASFPTVPVFFYQTVNTYNQNILTDNRKLTMSFICHVCVECI